MLNLQLLNELKEFVHLETIQEIKFSSRFSTSVELEIQDCANYKSDLNDEFDVAVRFFIRKKIFDIDFMNAYLNELNLKLIGNIV